MKEIARVRKYLRDRATRSCSRHCYQAGNFGSGVHGGGWNGGSLLFSQYERPLDAEIASSLLSLGGCRNDVPFQPSFEKVFSSFPGNPLDIVIFHVTIELEIGGWFFAKCNLEVVMK